MASTSSLQRQLNALLKKEVDMPEGPSLAAGGVETPGRIFSPFIQEHLDRAVSLASSFMMLADTIEGDEGLAAVLQAAKQLEAEEGVESVQHALKLFFTHHPKGSRLRIPTLEERAPARVLPSQAPDGPALATGVATEADLNWYREDAWANDHHDHWHVVYPSRGVSTAGGRALKERHGELFFYMHEQMLARYDTERVALGLERVKPLNDYDAPIPEGYDPGINPEIVSGASGDPSRRYSPRASGITLANVNRPDQGIPPYAVSTHETLRDRLDDAVDTGNFTAPGLSVPVTSDALGATVEASIGSVSGSRYGNHHGMGHVLIALAHDPRGNTWPGVMLYTDTAIRDPVFYRWHRHVDDFLYQWQEDQPPNDFSDAPPVRIRKSLGTGGGTAANASPDIILCFRKDIRGARGRNFNGQAFGERAFGGSNWNSAFSSGGVSTNELQTMMLKRSVRLRDGSTREIPYLDHEEFFYFLRVENTSRQAQEVTVRIFLAAVELADERRMWIEMDKFKHPLAPNQKAVIFRPGSLSSVIRKPASKPPRPPRRRRTESATDSENYCNCGWPYNLLVPRGSDTGMPFRLFVMVTHNDDVEQSSCGSMSFCGVRNRYPDRRAMGYPFDRPFPANRTLAQTVAAQQNMATRDITIRWTNPGS
ncbi:MAG TPA: tyrosinase family protein [Chloroflexia bacterium]|nr:tyrosinase family protein [Chloroflexia bacterium]